MHSTNIVQQLQRGSATEQGICHLDIIVHINSSFTLVEALNGIKWLYYSYHLYDTRNTTIGGFSFGVEKVECVRYPISQQSINLHIIKQPEGL
jgi:hypothetical protein